MTDEQVKALRAPFKPEQIGKLPKPTNKNNPKGRCPECGGWHGLPAVHLDYVGHAAVTDRLLSVDPEWTWEPAAVGPNGEPLIVDGGLWIRLTVGGVTRLGFGDNTMGHGLKEMIGDAIRNAAMRFGVALDLWAKESLGAPDSTPAPKSSGGVSKAQHAKIGAVIKDLQAVNGEVDWVAASRAYAKEQFGKTSRADLNSTEAGNLIEHLEACLKAEEAVQAEAQEIPF